MKRWNRFVTFVVIFSSFVLIPGRSVNGSELGGPAEVINGFWECYDDGTSDPCRNNLNKVVVLSSDNAWIVGDHGTILHWDGSGWSLVPSPMSENLNSIDMLTPNDGWAVGGGIDNDGGGLSTILHWDGITWAEVPSPATNELAEVDFLTAVDGWAVGWQGEIIHWNGSEWTTIDQSLASTLNSIDILSGDNVWAVGRDTGYQPLIIHWDGVGWSSYSLPEQDVDLVDIDMITETDGWAVGTNYKFYRWNGSEWIFWEASFPSNGAIMDVNMNSATDGWAVGDFGATFHWDGTTWNAIEGLAGGSPALRSVSVKEGTGWSVGQAGAIRFFNGSAWVDFNTNIFDIDFSSPNDGWAVGDNSLILHWDGNTWVPLSLPVTANIWSVSAVSPENAWAGTGSKLLHWNGTEWSVSDEDPYKSYGIIDADETNIWVGGGFAICNPTCYDVSSRVSHWDGMSWTTNSLQHIYINTLEMLSPTLGWAGGDYWDWSDPKPTIFQWDGSTWSEVSYITLPISDISATSANEAWAVNKGGVPIVYHWDGTFWNEIQVPSGSHPYKVDISPEGEVWLAGGTMLHWNGTDWDQLSKPTGAAIYDIEMLSKDKGWAVGQTGVILEFKIPSLTINFTNGSPGSYFNLTGNNFPRNETATITVNGHELGTIQVKNDGSFAFTLSTVEAGEGIFYVTVSINPSATVKLKLDEENPLRTKDGDYETFTVPSGIGFTNEVFLPTVRR